MVFPVALIDLTWLLANELQGSVYHYGLFQISEARDTCDHDQIFTWLLGIQTRALMLVQQDLHR